MIIGADKHPSRFIDVWLRLRLILCCVRPAFFRLFGGLKLDCESPNVNRVLCSLELSLCLLQFLLSRLESFLRVGKTGLKVAKELSHIRLSPNVRIPHSYLPVKGLV